MQKITTFLMFNNQAEEAMKFYTSVFPNSKITSLIPGADRAQGGTFEVDGQTLYTFNGGPHFSFSEGISLFITCKDQKEIDYYWQKLTEGGAESRCGWLKDKFGVSWQVVPENLGTFLQERDPVKGKRIMEAFFAMSKIIIADLEAASKG
ncbi:MAG TPA: VOC family protein [Candidatus Kapabacteria bacterium]|nr:VOC family protein [Candidatus Kapabacteria bacterium]